jgi:hypothetical protein
MSASRSSTSTILREKSHRTCSTLRSRRRRRMTTTDAMKAMTLL